MGDGKTEKMSSESTVLRLWNAGGSVLNPNDDAMFDFLDNQGQIASDGNYAANDEGIYHQPM